MSQIKSTTPESENSEKVEISAPEPVLVTADKKPALENLLKETPRFDAIKIGLAGGKACTRDYSFLVTRRSEEARNH